MLSKKIGGVRQPLDSSKVTRRKLPLKTWPWDILNDLFETNWSLNHTKKLTPHLSWHSWRQCRKCCQFVAKTSWLFQLTTSSLTFQFDLKLAIFPANDKVISHIFSPISTKTLPTTNIFLHEWFDSIFYFENLCDSYKMYSVTVSESEFFLIIGIWSLYKFLRWFKKLLPLNFLLKWIFDVCNLMAQILVKCNWIVLSTKGFPALETFESNPSVQFGSKMKSLSSFWFWRIKQKPT